MPRPSAGYTLVELVVVMLIFSMVMTLISLSFNRIVASSGQVAKSAETDIEGMVGLELFRVDLGFAGFGLPWELGSAYYLGEAKKHLVDGNPDADAASFNDKSEDGPPRAFVMLNDKGFNDSDYLVLKGSALGGAPGRSWSYLSNSAGVAVVKPSKSADELAPGRGDRVIVINTGVRGGMAVRDLVADANYLKLTLNEIPPVVPDAYRPRSSQDSYLVYGISDGDFTFPFNRADYYLGPSDTISSFCAPGTGSLYRAPVIQKSNELDPYPILDCVADLQVIFMLQDSTDGALAPTNDIGGYGAKELRELVKEVRVYILAQQGKKDPAYRYPVADPDLAIKVGDAGNGRVWTQSELAETFGSDWLHYHWKVYAIAVQPKSLN